MTAIGPAAAAVSNATITATVRPAPQRRPARMQQASCDQASWDFRLNLFTLLLHSCVQVVELRAWGSLPPSERAQRVLSCIHLLVPTLLAALAPKLYLRCVRAAGGPEL